MISSLLSSFHHSLLFCLCRASVQPSASAHVSALRADLIEKRSCVTTVMSSLLGQANEPSGCCSALFLIEGADIFQAAIDFHCVFFILLLCPQSIWATSCPGDTWDHIQSNIGYTTLHVKLSVQDTQQLVLRQDYRLQNRLSFTTLSPFFLNSL